MKELVRLLRFAKKYWGWALVAFVTMFLVSIFATLQAYLIKPLFDDLLMSTPKGLSESSGIISCNPGAIF